MGAPIFILCLTGALITIFDYLRSPEHPIYVEAMRFVVTIHRWFFLPNRLWGSYLTGIASFLFIVVNVTGILLCLPKRKKNFKRLFIFRLRKGFTLYNLHRIAGVYVSLWLILLSATGMAYAFPTIAEQVAGVLQVEHVPESVRFQQMPQEDGTIKEVDLDEMMTPHQKMMVWVSILHTGKWGNGVGEIINVLAVLEGCVLVVTGYILYFKRKRK